MNTSVSRTLLLPEVTMMPTVTSVAIVTVLVFSEFQLVPSVERSIWKELPVRVTRSQQFGGVSEAPDVLEMFPPVLLRRNARMLLLPEPRCTTAANLEFAAVDSRTIAPASEAVVVPLWLESRTVIEPSPLIV